MEKVESWRQEDELERKRREDDRQIRRSTPSEQAGRDYCQ